VSLKPKTYDFLFSGICRLVFRKGIFFNIAGGRSKYIAGNIRPADLILHLLFTPMIPVLLWQSLVLIVSDYTTWIPITVSPICITCVTGNFQQRI